MLNGSADAEREIQFGCNRLTGRSNLAVHGQPARIADGTRGRNLATESFGELLGNFDILLLFYAATDSDDNFGLGKINCLLCFFENLVRFVADDVFWDLHINRLDGSGTRFRLNLVPTKSSILKSDEPGRVAGEADIGCELALEHLASEEQLVSFFLVADAVADCSAIHGGGKFGHEIANLIGVWHQDELGLLRRDELFERGDERVGRVGLELG